MLKPFKIEVPDADLDDLRRRLEATRLPSEAGFENWEDGTPASWLSTLVSYWRDGYDWRAQEAALNRFTHLRGEVSGTTVHCIHERGKGPAPFPLLLAHGYPDSVHRFHKIIQMLADPGAHGGDPRDAFDVVAPSLPGYGWSDARTAHGGAFGFGDLFHKLMTQDLGYDRYGAHGGDWGSTIATQLARDHSAAVAGVHLTDVPFWHAFDPPADISSAEKKYLADSETFQKEGGAYAMIQGTRPATPAAALNDSPVGLAGWIIEKFKEWSDCHGDVEARFTKDELLTNVMIYWTTQTIRSSFLPYRDFMKAGPMRWTKEAVKGWTGSDATPAAFALFPGDILTPPREWAARFYNVQRWTEMPQGGHFAAMEEPERLAEDIRSFFRPLRHKG